MMYHQIALKDMKNKAPHVFIDNIQDFVLNYIEMKANTKESEHQDGIIEDDQIWIKVGGDQGVVPSNRVSK